MYALRTLLPCIIVRYAQHMLRRLIARYWKSFDSPIAATHPSVSSQARANDT